MPEVATAPAIEVPIRITGMEDYRRMLAEIRRGAKFFQDAGLGVNVNIYIGSFPEPKPEPPKTCGSVGDMGDGVRGILICGRAPNHGGMHESNPGAFDAYRWSDEQVASRARGANV